MTPSADHDRRDERKRGSAGRRAATRSADRRAQRPAPPFDDDRDPDHDLDPSDPVGTPEQAVPVRRMLSLGVAAFSVLATVALALGAHTERTADAVVVFGMQLLFVAVWTIASRPPAPRVVAGVGVAVAIGTDAAAVLVDKASLEPLAYLTAAGFILGVIGQLLRPAGRVRVTESLGSSLVVAVGVVAFATLIELTRHPHGTQSLVACMGAAGLAVAVARIVDIVAPIPRIAPQVPRGGIGVVLGAMAGTGCAAIAGFYLDGLETRPAALAGLATAVVAVMIDLSVGYAEAGRDLEGEPSAFWLARHAQGPLGALAFAAPVAYTASVLLLGLI